MLRLARTADAPACAALVAALVPELNLARPGIERFAASIAPARQATYIAHHRYWVAEQDGRVVGLAALRAPRHLFHLFVAEDLQGRGLGLQLFRQVTAGEEHLPLTLNSSLAAIGFYTRLGFRPTQALQFADGIAFPADAAIAEHRVMDLPASLDMTQLLALAATLGLASGLRLYAAVFLTGLAGHLGWVTLPAGLQLLQTPTLLWGSAALMAAEFVADKIPWFDSLWDAVHSFIRIPAGAALAYGVFGGQADAQAWALLAALAGGALAASTHAAKTSTRAAVNHSPEPFTNWSLSLAGDLLVPGLLWLSWEHPWAALAMALLVSLTAISLSLLLGRFVLRFWRRRRAPSDA